jgi:3-hydroxybutyryl-CoA dehydrogenase
MGGNTVTAQTQRLLLVGELPWAAELARLCADAGHGATVYLEEDVLDAAGIDRLRKDAAQAEVAIDMMSGSIEAKRTIVTALDAALPPGALLITSALSATVTLAGSWVRNPGRVVGFGALPPLAKGGLVELAAGLRTDAAWLERAGEFFASIGMETARVTDSIGLVLPRIVCGLVNEAATALAEGVADAKDIDLAMRLGTNYPRGPLEWGDLIGLDVVLSVLRGLHAETGDDRSRPAPILQQYVRAGWLGRKTGRGFYEYREVVTGQRPPVAPSLPKH